MATAEAPARVIEARGLTRHFAAFTAVNGLDLDVAAGEVFGLLGANGAGKTTAIRMLCAALRPSSGQATVAGVDMLHQARRARGQLGYVTQGFTLYGDLTVMENLRLQAGLYGLYGRRRGQRLDWALDYLHLHAHRNRPAGALPLGYQRRLALAGALLHEPAVLFLDEPTSGVDPLARQHFWDLIYDLADSGIGILVTTHYMDEAMFCDRLALMQAGEIIAEGTPDALLQRELPTPLLELEAPGCAHCGRALEAMNEVLEVVPRANRLRVRLAPDADIEDARAAIERTIAGRQARVARLEPVAPELEDVFVALIEDAER